MDTEKPRFASETDLEIPALREVSPENPPFPGVFIRAPLITAVGSKARVLSLLPDGRIVAAEQGYLMATAFHPELTDDDRVHQYFIHLVANKLTKKK